MHEYHHHFVEYGSPTTNQRLVTTNSSFQTSFVGSTVGPLVRPPPPIPPSNTQTIPPLAYTEVKLEPQALFPPDISNESSTKPYKCYQCGYSSTLKSNLNQHVTCVHASVKPFKCSL